MSRRSHKENKSIETTENQDYVQHTKMPLSSEGYIIKLYIHTLLGTFVKEYHEQILHFWSFSLKAKLSFKKRGKMMR